MPVSLTKNAQAIILANTLKGHQTATSLLTAMQPDDWTVSEYKEIWKVLQEYWNKYHKIPKDVEIVESVTATAAAELPALYSISGYDDVPALVDLVSAYLKAKQLRLSIDQAGSVLTTDPMMAEQILRDGLATMPTMGYTSDSIIDLLPSATYDYKDSTFGLPTGIRMLDYATGGGVGLGEVFITAAPSGGGKSTTLSSICGNVAHLTPCLFISLELKKERIAQLIAAKVGRVPQSQFNDNLPPEKFVQIQTRLRRCFPIKIMYYPSNSISVSQIGAMIDYMRHVEGQNIGAVFIDYADLLVTTRYNMNYKADWERICSVYQELVDVARTFNVAIFTATQVQRGAYGIDAGLKPLQKEDVAGSIEKINKCDVAIGFKPFMKDGAVVKGILSFMKVRSGEAPPPQVAALNYDTLQLRVLYEFGAQEDAMLLNEQPQQEPEPHQGAKKKRRVLNVL